MKTNQFKISLIGILFLIVQGFSAQNNSGEIKGKVLELETGDPLAYANVYVKIGEQLVGTITDFDGRFTLKPLSPGVYNVSISFTGTVKVIEGVEVNPEKITFLDDFQFSNMLGVVDVVRWERKLIDKGNPSIHSIGMKEIQLTPLSRNPVQLLNYTVPGVNLDANGGVSIRGSRVGDVAYYIDGVKASSLAGIPGRAIGNISVYTGGVPAQYGDVTGGVIMIETVSYFDLYNAKKAKQKNF